MWFLTVHTKKGEGSWIKNASEYSHGRKKRAGDSSSVGGGRYSGRSRSGGKKGKKGRTARHEMKSISGRTAASHGTPQNRQGTKAEARVSGLEKRCEKMSEPPHAYPPPSTAYKTSDQS